MYSDDDMQRYLDMIKAFPLRPIHSDEVAVQAFQMAQGYRLRRLTQSECDYLEVLEDLIEKYDSRHGDL